MQASNQDLLDNIFWHALAGEQAWCAQGGKDARRYAPGFSPIVAFPDRNRANFSALRPYCGPDEHFYCDGWSGELSAGWNIDQEGAMVKMIWAGGMPPVDEATDAIKLGEEHSTQALALAELTHPGPFGLRTIELGEYFGYFEGPRLIAMAGERAHAGSLREISGVCTHPDSQGRGLARRLMTKLIRRQLQRNQIPVLHVMVENSGARRLYERIGFRIYKESVVRVVSLRCD
jgi:ribosomal protein S18 acetylase RimI-like enzyme